MPPKKEPKKKRYYKKNQLPVHRLGAGVHNDDLARHILRKAINSKIKRIRKDVAGININHMKFFVKNHWRRKIPKIGTPEYSTFSQAYKNYSTSDDYKANWDRDNNYTTKKYDYGIQEAKNQERFGKARAYYLRTRE